MTPAKPASPFRLSDIFFSMACIALFVLLLENGFEYISSLPLPRSQLTLGLFIVQEIILLLPVFLLLRFRYHRPIRSLGVYGFKARRGVLSVFKWYVLYIIFSIALGLILNFFRTSIPGYGEGKDILPIFGNDQFTVVSMIVVICLIAPLAEELFFRGFIFRTLLQKMNRPLLASIITAILFSLVHFDPGAFLPRLLLGMILNQLVLENEQSIGPALLFHILNNSIALTVQLYM